MAIMKKPEQKRPGPITQQAGAVTINSVRLEPIENASVYYVNYIEVTTSPQDFSIIGGRLPAKLSEEKIQEIQSSGALTVEPDVHIVIPVTLVPAIIRALTGQKELYEKLYGIQIKEVEQKHE